MTFWARGRREDEAYFPKKLFNVVPEYVGVRSRNCYFPIMV